MTGVSTHSTGGHGLAKLPRSYVYFICTRHVAFRDLYHKFKILTPRKYSSIASLFILISVISRHDNWTMCVNQFAVSHFEVCEFVYKPSQIILSFLATVTIIMLFISSVELGRTL